MNTKIKVEGFHCKSCKMLVEDICSDFSEIKSCDVDVKTGDVTLVHEDSFDITRLKKEIESLGGYKVRL